MVTVCLTVDFDAVSPWLAWEDRNTPTNRSRGVFGAEVGAPRLLDTFDEYGVDTTWFVPGHTIESFPEPAKAVHAAGHEVAHHGYTHTPPGQYGSREAERKDIEHGIAAIEDLTGSPPAGYRSPSWDYSEHTPDLLLELGFDWSSSGMARDFDPYYHRDDDPDADPYDVGEETELLELPVSWQRDDYPAFAFSGDRAYSNERAVFREWTEQFDWLYEHDEEFGRRGGDDGDSRGGVFVLTMHPQVMGQVHRLRRLENFIEHAAGKPGVTFETLSDVAARY